MREVSIERLRQLFSLDENYRLIRIVSVPRTKAGGIAGDDDGKGYLRVRVDYGRYLVHRVVFALVHGRWPRSMLDHINGDTKDNRPENLREVDHRGNGTNRVSHRNGKLPGVCKRGKKWASGITVGGKRVHLGTYETEQLAYAAYKIACRRASEIENPTP